MLFCCLILQNFLARSKSIVIYLPSMTNKSEPETDNLQRVHGVKSSRISLHGKVNILGLETTLTGIAFENFRSGEAVLIPTPIYLAGYLIC